MRTARSSLAWTVVILCGLNLPAFPQEKTPDLLQGKPLRQWLQDMHAPDGPSLRVRRRVLDDYFAHGDEAVLQFCGLLDDKDTEVRSIVARVLGERGAQASKAVPALTKKFMEDDSWPVREESGRALWLIGQRDHAVHELIAKAIQTAKDPKLRSSATHSLRVKGSKPKILINALCKAAKDENAEVRRMAALSLSEAEGGEVATGALIDLLGDEEKEVGEMATYALVELGDGTIAALLDQMREGKKAARSRAVLALGQLCSKSEEAGKDIATIVSRIAERLKDEDAEMRQSAAFALGTIGKGAVEAIPQILRALRDEDICVRSYSGMALGRIGKRPKEVVPALTKALRDPAPSVRGNSAMALGRFGAEAAVAVPELINKVRDPDANVRRAAANALEDIAAKVKSARPSLEQR